MTTITVLAGERTIGGTQIVVEDQGARLLFDCGLAYDPTGDPFAPVRRRPWRALPDMLALGLAPHIPGLYDPRITGGATDGLPLSIPPTDGPLAVALSHAHLDHTHLVGFVEPEVPVHCAAATARIVRVLGELGYSLGPAGRPFTTHEPDQPFTVGPLRVRLLPVDHDVAGACGLVIETSDGTIAYSGDVRLHGTAPEWSMRFVQAARAARARLLIIEGTQLAPPRTDELLAPARPPRAERAVAAEALDALSRAPTKLGLILLTPEHGARVEALAGAMAEIGRLLVLDADGLAFATAALGRPLAAPHAVYVPAALERARQRGEALPAALERAIDAAPRVVTAGEIAREPGAFLLRLAWEDFVDLLELVPDGVGGVLLHANGTPLGPFDPGWTQLGWWARKFGLVFAPIDSSGHARPADLTTLARESGAPVVMAIHSRYPDLFDAGDARLILPVRGQSYRLAALDEA